MNKFKKKNIMKSILIPTDFSEAADNAYLYALHLANHLGLKVFVLYVYMPPILSATHGGQPDILQNIYDEIELSKFDTYKKNVQKLRILAEKHNLNSDNIIFLFEDGSLVQTIKKIIEKEDIYALVMGTTGATGISKAMIGSNTVDVIKNISKPVLAIPVEARFKPIEKAVFTTLYRQRDKKALEEIIHISDKLNFITYCVNVIDNDEYMNDVVMEAEEWAKEFNNSKLQFTFLEKNGTIENTINDFLRDNNIDVLAIVKRNRSFFDRLLNSSLSHQFVFHSHIPTWVFHEEK